MKENGSEIVISEANATLNWTKRSNEALLWEYDIYQSVNQQARKKMV